MKSDRHGLLRPIWRKLALLTIGLAGLWFAVAASWCFSFQRRAPAQAVALGYHSAEARASLALSLVSVKMDAAQKARVEQLATAAWRLDGTNVRALVALGALAAVRHQGAAALAFFSQSERLSRRDLPTQFWMIEHNVGREDITGALKHYDRALRTNRDSRATLLPVLSAAAAEDVSIATSIVPFLTARPQWGLDFITHFLGQRELRSENVTRVLGASRLSASVASERVLLATGIERLLDADQAVAATALYRQAMGVGPFEDGAIGNGDFEKPIRLAPFDWQLRDEGEQAATVEPDPTTAQGNVLALHSDGERGGEIARKTMTLAPGRYRLAWRFGGVAGDSLARPQVTVQCALSASGTAPLAHQSLPVSPDTAQTAMAFVVPAQGCRVQRLSVVVGTSLAALDMVPWVDQFVVAPTP